ncbi:hypothetical protein BJF78_17400 [Pseudonocardia sp. CNS-139]|nr:hypothetical protein BJF78_17400 [Pseudonocardia sp. CNS-139]
MSPRAAACTTAPCGRIRHWSSPKWVSDQAETGAQAAWKVPPGSSSSACAMYSSSSRSPPP